LVTLLAFADADVLFINFHVGDFGKKRDGSVYRGSTLGEMLDKKELRITFPTSLPLDGSGETLPSYFIVDEVFPLKIN
jgi:hypothetical protein